MIKCRKQMRLKEYNYSTSGSYFVTICTKNRSCLFGDIVDKKIQLNVFGELVQSQWKQLSVRFQNIRLDDHVILPNHIHGIISVINIVGAIHELPLQQKNPNNRIYRRNMLLPKIIGYFKMNTSKLINQIRQRPGNPVWQRNYYEHIIRNDKDLNRIQTYIDQNINNWENDRNNVPIGELL
ncbi:MAG: transposase [Candidatus Omnitrophota bacterium]